MSKEELLKYLIAEIDLIMHDKDYRFENQDGTWYSRESCIDLTNEEVFEELKSELMQLNSQVEKIADLEAKLAESEKKLNQYPYKNDVIEKQYKDLKGGIKFRIKNNINDDWEQLYHCIDVLCEKHKARIRDIENGICKIEQLEQQLADAEFRYENLHNLYYKDTEELKQQLAEKEEQINMLEEHKFYADNIIQAYADKCKKTNQDKISFAVKCLERVKRPFEHILNNKLFSVEYRQHIRSFFNEIDNQIKQLKEGK